MVMPLSFNDTFKRQTAAAQKCDNNSNAAPLNVTTGTGDFEGTSKSVKPTFNQLPQNNEPEKLVPNPEAFEQAKNDSNSATPPDRLTSSLENKTVIQPPLISSPE